MIPLTLAAIAGITRGTLHHARPETLVTGPVVIDSRAARPGAIFAAVRGSRVDGHDFAAAAVTAGAVAVLAQRPPAGAEVPAVIVDDVPRALGLLAHGVVARLPDTTVIGVTGSSGKTSTKDLIAQLFGRLGPTVAPVGSFNNEIGHPLTALRADGDTRYLVLEYSARGIGHIAYLTGVVAARVGVVLNVGTAHIGEFGGREKITQAKGELVEALPTDGTAVLNADDPLVRTMAGRTAARIVTFGRAPQAIVRATDERLDEQGRPRFTLVTPDAALPVTMRLHGAHAVSNALAAAAAAHAIGMPAKEITEALSEAVAVSRWRMEVTERDDGVTIVNDAYNANPESMRAALDTVRHIAQGTGAHARRAYAVLGEMAELGQAAEPEHEKIGRHAAQCGLAMLIVVGANAAAMVEGAKQVGSWTGECVQVDDVGAAVAVLGERLRPRDVVLIKGSRVTGLERVAQSLLDQEPKGRDGA